MYRIIIALFFAASFAACENNGNPSPAAAGTANAAVDTASLTTLQWIDSTVKSFGKIQEGQMLEISFRFKNIGKMPLVIEKVQPSCGCTVAEQSKVPVAPGAEGVIKGVFNSAGHPGTNHKSLTLFANTKGNKETYLAFIVDVEKKP